MVNTYLDDQLITGYTCVYYESKISTSDGISDNLYISNMLFLKNYVRRDNKFSHIIHGNDNITLLFAIQI